MAEKFNSTSFTPFLAGVKRASSNATAAIPRPVDLLTILAAAPAAKLDVRALVSLSEMPLSSVTNALRELERTGLISITQEDDTEVVALTLVGEGVVGLQL